MIRYCCARISAPVVDPISKIYGNWNHRIFGNAVNLTQYQKVTLFNLCLMLSTILRKHMKANDLISSLGLSIYWLHRLICWLLNKCITYILYWFSSQRGFFPCAELGSVKALPHPSEQTASPWCWDTQVPHSTAVPMSSLCHATCHGPCVLHTDGWGTVEGGAGLEHLWSCQWESWGRPLHCRATLSGVWHTSPSPITGICSHPKVLSNNPSGDRRPLSHSYNVQQGTESQLLAKGPNPAGPDEEWTLEKRGRGEGEMFGEMAGAFPVAEFSLTMSAVFQSKYSKHCLLRFIYVIYGTCLH